MTRITSGSCIARAWYAPVRRPVRPVMEFDADGNYVQGWGGSAPGYDWPQSEHGIYVDPKGFVWIGGAGNDDQILKFTKTGKFVMQIGKGGNKKSNQDTKNLWRPSDVFLYRENERTIRLRRLRQQAHHRL